VRKHPLLQMLVIGVVATAILIPIALIIPWFPTDASKQASSVHTLYDVLLIATVPIFVLVETVVLYSVWKFRMKPGEELKDGPPIHGNTRLEVVWTAVPAVLLIAMCTYAYVTLRHNEASQKGEMTINVTERQFAFEFSYPINGTNANQIVSPNLYLAKGQPVVFKIRSLDVIHSFFVPEFSEKIDAVPGITTTLRVTPTRVGTYPVECTELCGPGHSLMRTAAYVVSPARFQAWLRSQKPNGPPPVGEPPPNAAQPGVPGAASSAAAPSTSTTSSPPSASSSTAEGKAVFTTAGCSSCHTLAAAGATGTIGPDLDARLRTDCASAASKPIRGATLEECIHTAITKPYAFIPTGYHAGVMPATFAQTLSSAQIQALVNFLSSVAK
jgi:cytochrome c oxidase subunit 2